MRTVLLLLATASLVGCSRRGLPPEIDEFRSALADPTRYPVRQGTEVDEERLKAALESFARDHRERLEAHLQASLSSIPSGTLPAGPAFSQVHEADAELLESIREPARLFGALHPEAERILQLNVGMILAPLLSREALESAKIGPLVSFFSIARPLLRKQRPTEDRLTLIADYGSVDVLILTLERSELGWGPVGFAWWQRASGS